MKNQLEITEIDTVSELKKFGTLTIETYKHEMWDGRLITVCDINFYHNDGRLLSSIRDTNKLILKDWLNEFQN